METRVRARSSAARRSAFSRRRRSISPSEPARTVSMAKAYAIRAQVPMGLDPASAMRQDSSNPAPCDHSHCGFVSETLCFGMRGQQMSEEVKPRTVLLVDDAVDDTELYSMYLSGKGYEVEVAPDGAAAVDLA